jgi:hypothetical protein
VASKVVSASLAGFGFWQVRWWKAGWSAFTKCNVATKANLGVFAKFGKEGLDG